MFVICVSNFAADQNNLNNHHQMNLNEVALPAPHTPERPNNGVRRADLLVPNAPARPVRPQALNDNNRFLAARRLNFDDIIVVEIPND